MASRYGLYVSSGGQTLQIPVNPEKYPISKSNDNSEYNVLGIGPIMIPRIPKLRVISWDGLFPGRVGEGFLLSSSSFTPPQTYIDFFENAMDAMEPIQFIANRYYENGETIFDTNIDVLVTSFTYEERGGETGDFYYSVELTEYRDYSPQVISIQSTPQQTTATAEKQRSVPQGQLTVGCTVIANGKYWYTSYGDEPYGSCSNKRCKVSRIVTNDSTRPYPIHITTESGGWLGWLKKSQVQVVSE